MRRILGFAVCFALSLLATRGEAREPSDQPLPEGHPPVPGQAQEETGVTETSSGDVETTAGASELPPGHPPIDEAIGGSGKDPDGVREDTALPVGTVVVDAVDAQGRGIRGLQVRLDVVRESVEEGKLRSNRVVLTGTDGSATFAGMPSDSAHSYRVRIEHDSATFASPAFSLARGGGMRVRLHVYPATREEGATRLGSMARVYIRPHDEVLFIEAMFSIANLGPMAWVAYDVTFELPSEATAFTPREAGNTLSVVRDEGRLARLEGTVAPGLQSVVFSFQVPRHGARDEQVKLGVPPRLVQAEILAEGTPRMTLAVEGFPAATARRNEHGQRLLVTGARATSEAEALAGKLSITVGGLPVPGPGRWITLVLAGGLALGGVIARGRTGETAGRRGPYLEDVEEARALILNELVALERAREDGQVGPRTYEQARRELIDGLAQLEPQG